MVKKIIVRKKKGKVSSAVKSYVHKALDNAIEDKHFYGRVDAGNVLGPGALDALEVLTLPAQGTGIADRIGQEITVKYIHVRAEVRNSSATNAVVNTSIAYYRSIFIQQVHTDALAPIVTGTNQGIFQTTTPATGHIYEILNPVTCMTKYSKYDSTKNRFYRILGDKVKKFIPYYGGQTVNGANTIGNTNVYEFFHRYPKGKKVNFTAAVTGATASVQDVTFYLLNCVGSPPAGNTFGISYSWHICFEDA